MDDPRAYPPRPILAVSAAIVRDGRVLVVRRARPPAQNLFSLPGGVVEAGETLVQALKREIREELNLDIEPLELIGFREVIAPGEGGRAERHFVILSFAARLVAGDIIVNEEVAEARWVGLAELDALPITDGLVEIVAAALARSGAAG